MVDKGCDSNPVQHLLTALPEAVGEVFDLGVLNTILKVVYVGTEIKDQG